MARNATNDMTQGSPVKLIMAFMIPTYLGNLFQQFYNLADSVIAGRFIGVDALAAIGSTTSLTFLVLGWLNGLTSGFSILIAQTFGAGRYDRLRHYLAQSILLCAAFVAVMTVGLEWFNVPILRMMNAPEELLADIAVYMAIIYAGMFATAAYNFMAAVLRALGDGKSPLYFLMFSATLNVVLDIVFITAFGMGVEGCAYATVIAQGVSALMCFFYMKKKFDILKLNREDFQIDLRSMGKLLGMGIPMGLQFSITALGTIIVQRAINAFGAVYMASYSAAGKIQSIVTIAFVAYGATIATYTGQNRGAGRMDRVRRGVFVTQIMVLAWSVIAIVLLNLLGPVMVGLFVDTPNAEVEEAAMTYFRLTSWCYPFLGSIFIYRNALQGLGYGLVPMMGGIFELIARAVVVQFLAGTMGYEGICLAEPAAWMAALIPLVPYFLYQMGKVRKAERETGRNGSEI